MSELGRDGYLKLTRRERAERDAAEAIESERRAGVPQDWRQVEKLAAAAKLAREALRKAQPFIRIYASDAATVELQAALAELEEALR